MYVSFSDITPLIIYLGLGLLLVVSACLTYLLLKSHHQGLHFYKLKNNFQYAFLQ